jgi:hypothetical protein
MGNHGGIAYARRGNVGQNQGTKHVFHNCGGVSTLQGGQIVPYGETGGGHAYNYLSATGGDGQGYGNGGDGALDILTYNGGFVTQQNNGGAGSAGVIIVEEFYG